MIKSHKEILEARIARLEKLVKETFTSKFEEDKDILDLTPDERNELGFKYINKLRADRAKNKSSLKSRLKDIKSDIEFWFDNNMGPDMYDSKRAWVSDLRWMAKGAPNGSALDDCCDELGIDDIDKVAKTLAALAKDALDDISYNKAHGQDLVGRVWADPWA